MDRNLRNQDYLEKSLEGPLLKRPLIGVPTGREKSQRFFGLPLYIMNQSYIRALEMLGALPVMIPLQMSDETLRGIFDRLDGLLLPGGEDIDPARYGYARHPQLGPMDKERDRTELLMTGWSLETGMPVLGICRGLQVLNVACGGTLYQDLTSQRKDRDKHDYFPPTFERFRICHRVDIETDSVLASALGSAHEVNSMHHQGIATVGHGLRPVAISEDGLVEGLEAPDMPFTLGVQWHPEELVKTDQLHSTLFYNFVRAAAGDWREQPSPKEGAHSFTMMPFVNLETPAYKNGYRNGNGNGTPPSSTNGVNGSGVHEAGAHEVNENDLVPACF